MKNPPAFQFYAADFLVGVLELSDEEVGVYMRMLAFEWVHGSLPSDPKMIKKCVNSCRKPSEKVLGKFEKMDSGRLVNRRLENEREKQINFRNSRINGGKAKAENAKLASAHAEKMQGNDTCINAGLQSSSSPSGLNTTPAAKAADNWKESFAEFWKLYPKKHSRQEAEKKWAKLSEAKRAAAFEGLKRLLPTWSTDPRYILNPVTFINNERWDDEPILPIKANGNHTPNPRVVGTRNEGTAAQYAGIGRFKPSPNPDQAGVGG